MDEKTEKNPTDFLEQQLHVGLHRYVDQVAPKHASPESKHELKRCWHAKKKRSLLKRAPPGALLQRIQPPLEAVQVSVGPVLIEDTAGRNDREGPDVSHGSNSIFVLPFSRRL